MKLRNKKTGEIIDVKDALTDSDDYPSHYVINDEWEDAPEEPKNEIYWYIESDGEVMDDRRSWHMTESDYEWEQGKEVMKRIGNYFSSKEEAEKAVEKLKTWKRLKDRGFRFEGFDGRGRGIRSEIEIYADIKNPGDYAKDLDLLFSGEDD